MNKKYLIGLGIICIVITLFALLKHLPANRQDQGIKLRVTTSFYPLYFFVSTIGGNKITVTNITPTGAEPHDYEPTPGDIAAIEQSKILIVNGGHLEAWGDDIRKNIDPQRTMIVTAGEGLTTQTIVENNKEIIDPHVWLSPVLAKQMTAKILAAITVADPGNKTYYEENAAQLDHALDTLDQEYKTGLSACERKDFVTSHAAFGYLAVTYGLHQTPIAGLSPDSEPSPKQLADITQFVRAHGIHVIFFESLVSPKLSQTIAKETSAQTMVLDPIEGLSDLDLRAGRNYLTVMGDNLAHLKSALSCK